MPIQTAVHQPSNGDRTTWWITDLFKGLWFFITRQRWRNARYCACLWWLSSKQQLLLPTTMSPELPEVKQALMATAIWRKRRMCRCHSTSAWICIIAKISYDGTLNNALRSNDKLAEFETFGGYLVEVMYGQLTNWSDNRILRSTSSSAVLIIVHIEIKFSHYRSSKRQSPIIVNLLFL